MRGDMKSCEACGRPFEWRRKWSRDWENVRFCSARCRNRRPDSLDRHLEVTIRRLLDVRDGGSMCPSEAARIVARAMGQEDKWRSLLERTRNAARRLAAKGVVEITQRGARVNPGSFKGPISVRAL
jgi:hypothetical protein